MITLFYGLITGILFGFLLQKGEVLRYDKQIGALRLQDMTIVKFMLSHIAVAMVGVYFLYDLGIVKLSIKSTILGGVVIGAIIFGIGLNEKLPQYAIALQAEPVMVKVKIAELEDLEKAAVGAMEYLQVRYKDTLVIIPDLDAVETKILALI